MARSKRFWWCLRLPCIVALGLALTAEGRTTSDSSRAPAGPSAPVSLMADGSACKPGPLENTLNRWLDSTEGSDFESEYLAMAFDELVDLVHALRDIAQDFCM